MRKFKQFIDLDKEEAWLRAMSAEGWAFRKRGFFGYTFDRSDAGERIYRIDYRAFRKLSDYLDYLLLFHDAGWEHVDGSKNSGYHYFVAAGSNAGIDIFSDEATKAARYRSLAVGWGSLLVVYLALLVVAVSTGNFDWEVFSNPAKLYLTPGLWEAEGVRFWFSFLFETPFALLRGIGPFLLPVLLVGSVAMIALSAFYLFKTDALRRRDDSPM